MQHLSTSDQAAPASAEARTEIPGAGRLALLAWASVFAVALLIWMVEASLGPELALRQVRGDRDRRQAPPALLVPGDFLLLTMTVNAAILAWAIQLDFRAKTVGREQDERMSLAAPSFLAVGAVTIWANVMSERAGLSDSLPMTIGVVLPTLATTAFLLWRSVLELKRSVPRVALLTCYVVTVAALELWLCGRSQPGKDEIMISAHSLLIGLAVGVRLAVWCATESPSTAQEAP